LRRRFAFAKYFFALRQIVQGLTHLSIQKYKRYRSDDLSVEVLKEIADI